VVFALTGLRLRAADLEDRFLMANRLYEEGKYADAVAAYDKLLDTGRTSAALLFNRGNALFKLGETGKAINSYRLAQELAPRDLEIRFNLQFARSKARGGMPFHRGLGQRWLETLSTGEWTLLTAFTLWIFFALLAIGALKPDAGRRLRVWLLVDGAFLLLVGVSLVCVLNTKYLIPSGVVITSEAEIRNGPLDESPTIFKVRDGIEFTVLDQKDGWMQILDPSDRVGWVRQDQVLLFHSPEPRPAS
jgi:hypothetical protein